MIIYFSNRKNTLDSLLATSILLYRYPGSRAVKISENTLEHMPSAGIRELINSQKIFLIDAGNSFNPELKNYDHHHDLTLYCSLKLVLIHEMKIHPAYLNLGPFHKIDLIDKHFLPTNPASAKLYRNLPPETRILENYLSFFQPSPEMGEFVLKTLKDKNRDTYYTFLVKLISIAGKRKNQALKNFLEYKKKVDNIIKSTLLVKTRKLTVAISHHPVSPYYTEVISILKPDVLIERKSDKISRVIFINNHLCTTENVQKVYLLTYSDSFSGIYEISAPSDMINIEKLVHAVTT